MAFAKKFLVERMASLLSAGALFVVLFSALLFFSCIEPVDPNRVPTPDPNYVQVKFTNLSSYYVGVHLGSFSGWDLVGKLEPRGDSTRPLSPSDNFTAFSIRYWSKIASASDEKYSSGDVWTSAIEPSMHIQRTIKHGSDCECEVTIRNPPDPSKLEFSEAFIHIYNNSDRSIEFNVAGEFLPQTGNGERPVPSGKTGIYKFVTGYRGIEIYGYTVTQVFEQYPFPSFTAESGYEYRFVFDGKSVEKDGYNWERSIRY